MTRSGAEDGRSPPGPGRRGPRPPARTPRRPGVAPPPPPAPRPRPAPRGREAIARVAARTGPAARPRRSRGRAGSPACQLGAGSSRSVGTHVRMMTGPSDGGRRRPRLPRDQPATASRCTTSKAHSALWRPTGPSVWCAAVPALEGLAVHPGLEVLLGRPPRVDQEGVPAVRGAQQLEGLEARHRGDLAGAGGEAAHELVRPLRVDLDGVDADDAHWGGAATVAAPRFEGCGCSCGICLHRRAGWAEGTREPGDPLPTRRRHGECIGWRGRRVDPGSAAAGSSPRVAMYAGGGGP